MGRLRLYINIYVIGRKYLLDFSWNDELFEILSYYTFLWRNGQSSLGSRIRVPPVSRVNWVINYWFMHSSIFKLSVVSRLDHKECPAGILPSQLGSINQKWRAWLVWIAWVIYDPTQVSLKIRQLLLDSTSSCMSDGHTAIVTTRPYRWGSLAQDLQSLTNLFLRIQK